MIFTFISVVALLCPAIGLILTILFYTKNKKVKQTSILFGLNFSAIIYGYIADSSNDIFRHIEALSKYKNINLFEAFNVNKQMSNLFTWDIWSWIIAKTNNPYLLQASAALIGYSIISYLVLDYCNINKIPIKKSLIYLLLAYTLVSPLSIAIGIRCSIAMLLSCLAFYLIIIKNKKPLIPILLSLMSIFLHHATIIIFVIYLIYPIYKKHKILILAAIPITLLLFTNYADYISLLQGNSIITGLLTDTLNSATIYKNIGIHSLNSIVSVTIQTILASLILIRPISRNKNRKKIDKQLWNLELLFYVLTISMMVILEMNGNRYFICPMILGLLPIISSDNYMSLFKTKNKAIIDIMIALCCIITMSINIYNMDWGTGSIASLAESFFTGYLSRL